MTTRRAFLGTLGTTLGGIGMLAHPGLARAVSLSGNRTVSLAATASRSVTTTVWNTPGPRKGTILFSHGFGSAPEFYPDWITAWVNAGYDIHAPLHTDSRQHPLSGKLGPGEGWKSRIEDLRAVSAAIGGAYVCAGHSFGALTALVAGGVAADIPDGIEGPLADPNASAVIAFSPPGTLPGLVSREAFAALSRPALVQTGTRDNMPAAKEAESWRGHFTAFAEARPGEDRFGLILDGVDHYFGGLICDPEKTGPDQREQLALATQVSLAFLDRFAEPADGARSGAPNFPKSSLASIFRK